MPNAMVERRHLSTVLGQDVPSNLFVRVTITAEVALSAAGEDGVLVHVLLQPTAPVGTPRVYDLLEYAPAAAWRQSLSLTRAVDRGWLSVIVTEPAASESVQAGDDEDGACCGLPAPEGAVAGDILSFDGDAWVAVTGGDEGEVLTKGADGEVPTWAPVVGDGVGIMPPSSPQTGDLLVHNGATWIRFGTGSAGQVLTAGGAATMPSWGPNEVAPSVATLANAASIALDFSPTLPTYKTVSIAQNTTFTTTNRGVGRTLSLRIICDGTQRTLTFPAAWRFLGSAPTNIAADTVGVLSLVAFGSADDDVVAAYAVTSLAYGDEESA